VTPDFVRLSIGIESLSDILADLDSGFIGIGHLHIRRTRFRLRLRRAESRVAAQEASHVYRRDYSGGDDSRFGGANSIGLVKTQS